LNGIWEAEDDVSVSGIKDSGAKGFSAEEIGAGDAQCGIRTTTCFLLLVDTLIGGTSIRMIIRKSSLAKNPALSSKVEEEQIFNLPLEQLFRA
jgi:hypothetical protein